jgi:hypothetical protein
MNGKECIMRKVIMLVCAIAFGISAGGCAGIDAPRPENIINDPITASNYVKVGMSAAQVRSIYGEPGAKSMVTSKIWGGTREEWFYRARMSAIPLSTGYLGKDLYLYFDGDNLTNISDSPMGESPAAPEATKK